MMAWKATYLFDPVLLLLLLSMGRASKHAVKIILIEVFFVDCNKLCATPPLATLVGLMGVTFGLIEIKPKEFGLEGQLKISLI